MTLGFGWGAAATMLGLSVRVISVLEAGIPCADSVAGLRTWRHGRGTRVRRQVLGGGHRHETHAEVPSERSQISDFPNCGWGVVLGGTADKRERNGKITDKVRNIHIPVLPFYWSHFVVYFLFDHKNIPFALKNCLQGVCSKRQVFAFTNHSFCLHRKPTELGNQFPYLEKSRSLHCWNPPAFLFYTVHVYIYCTYQ